MLDSPPSFSWTCEGGFKERRCPSPTATTCTGHLPPPVPQLHSLFPLCSPSTPPHSDLQLCLQLGQSPAVLLNPPPPAPQQPSGRWARAPSPRCSAPPPRPRSHAHGHTWPSPTPPKARPLPVPCHHPGAACPPTCEQATVIPLSVPLHSCPLSRGHLSPGPWVWVLLVL